jgi:hypothetical protein
VITVTIDVYEIYRRVGGKSTAVLSVLRALGPLRLKELSLIRSGRSGFLGLQKWAAPALPEAAQLLAIKRRIEGQRYCVKLTTSHRGDGSPFGSFNGAGKPTT